MKTIKITFLTLIAVVSLACSNDDDNHNNQPDVVETELSVIAKGTSVAQAKTIVHPQTGKSLEAFCFLMDLVDAKTGEVIGTVEDCDVGTTEFEDGTLVSQVITKFNFSGKGSITSESSVLQTPIGDGRFTTIFEPIENNIIDATFEFEGAEGTATLNGEVDLSQFDNNIIIFNCVFDLKFKNYLKQ